MPGIVRSKIEELRYSTDYATNAYDHATSTWTNIPVKQVRQEGSNNPGEESETDADINGVDGSAGKTNTWAYAIAAKDDDVFLDELETAEADLQAVWIWVKPVGQDARIIGGRVGCQVMVDRQAVPDSGTLANAIVSGGCTGNVAGDTYEIVQPVA